MRIRKLYFYEQLGLSKTAKIPSNSDMESSTFWGKLQILINSNGTTIDRPKGSAHHKFTTTIYPIDYGYINNTTSGDGSGIDVFIGTSDKKIINGVLCSCDLFKNDAEITIIYSCTMEEIAAIKTFYNRGLMSSIFVENRIS